MTRQEQFKRELKILLAKYNASISTPCEKGVSGVQYHSTPEWLFHSLTKAEEWVAANSGGHYRYIISEVQFYPNEHKDERV